MTMLTSKRAQGAIPIALILLLCLPVVAWGLSVRDPSAYFTYVLPPGQRLFVFGKLAALLAITLYWMQAVLALANRIPWAHGRPLIGANGHRRLGLATFAMVSLHVGLFVTAAVLRAGPSGWAFLLPNFTHGYYAAMVSVGLIAFWLLILGVFAGWRVTRGATVWRKVHALWPVVFALGFIHAFAIGSESRFGFMRYLFLFIALSLLASGLLRVRSEWRRRRAVGQNL